MDHIATEDLERYHLGMIQQPEELAVVEEHLLWCHSCLDRMEAVERFVSLVHAGLIRGEFEIELLAEEYRVKR